MDRTYAGTYQCPKHVVMYMPSLRGGGAERVMLGLAAGLVERGLHVDLVLVRAEGEYLHQVPEAVRVIDLELTVEPPRAYPETRPIPTAGTA